MTDTEEEANADPDKWGHHVKEFPSGGESGVQDWDRFVGLVAGDMERLANEVERPCKIKVSIEVYNVEE